MWSLMVKVWRAASHQKYSVKCDLTGDFYSKDHIKIDQMTLLLDVMCSSTELLLQVLVFLLHNQVWYKYIWN